MESAAQAARADANALRPIFLFCQLLRALPPPLCHRLQLQKGNIVTFQLFATLQVTKVLLPGGPESISASPAPDNVSWREYSNQTWIMSFASESAAQVGKSEIPAAADVPWANQVFDSSLLRTTFQVIQPREPHHGCFFGQLRFANRQKWRSRDLWSSWKWGENFDWRLALQLDDKRMNRRRGVWRSPEAKLAKLAIADNHSVSRCCKTLFQRDLHI